MNHYHSRVFRALEGAKESIKYNIKGKGVILSNIIMTSYGKKK